jgi:hypothetical protein
LFDITAVPATELVLLVDVIPLELEEGVVVVDTVAVSGKLL